MESEFTPDLTEPVEAAARRYHEEFLKEKPGYLPEWDELPDVTKVDAGPDVPLPPSVYSALLREFAEEVACDE